MLKLFVSSMLLFALSLFAQTGIASTDRSVYAASDYSALAPPGIADQAAAKQQATLMTYRAYVIAAASSPSSAVVALTGHIAAAPQRQDFP